MAAAAHHSRITGHWLRVVIELASGSVQLAGLVEARQPDGPDASQNAR